MGDEAVSREGLKSEISAEESRPREGELSKLRERLDRLREEKRGISDMKRSLEKRALPELPKRYLFAIALVIIVAAIYIRLPMLSYAGFFEPDGFLHFSVINQAIANNLVVPMYSQLSGFSPNHFPVTEPAGLYYVTLIPYSFLRYIGISAYTIERLIPLLFGVLDVIGAYFLARYLARSRTFGLIAMFMVAFSGGDAARTTALVYRGDGFITIFLIIGLLLVLRALSEDSKRKYAYMVLGAVVLGIGTAVWNGSPFVIIVYILAVMFLIVYGFIANKERLLGDTIFLSLALLITYAIENALIYSTLIRGQLALSSWHFFIFYSPMLLGAILFYFISRSRIKLFGSAAKRALFLAALSIAAAAIVMAGFYSYLEYVATGQGLVIAGNALTQTIQELQQPTLGFLWVSFSIEVFLAPIGIVCFILLSRKRAFEGVRNARLYEGFAVMLAYLIVTAYLQANAIRYNSLLSVPLAVFAAYAAYSIGKLLLGYRVGRIKAVYPYAALMAVIFAAIIIVAYAQASTEVQADAINPAFLNATLWLRGNSPQNAKILALWPDGSVVEGFGDRQSLMDSVSGQNPDNIANFSMFLFNTSTDSRYLYSVHPDYLLVRNFWFSEFGGIAAEGYVRNTSDFGLDIMAPMAPVRNGTQTIFSFNGTGFRAYMIVDSSNSSNRIAAFMSYNNGPYVPVRRVLFYNNDNGTFSFANLSANGSSFTLFVTYTSRNGIFGIGSGAILGPKLPQSNFFKLLVLCNQNVCAYGDNSISLTTVYANPDTKIFKVNYLK